MGYVGSRERASKAFPSPKQRKAGSMCWGKPLKPFLGGWKATCCLSSVHCLSGCMSVLHPSVLP